MIETGGNDPGAFIREGRARTSTPDEIRMSRRLFHAAAAIGDLIATGELLGFVGAAPIMAPQAGRVRG